MASSNSVPIIHSLQLASSEKWVIIFHSSGEFSSVQFSCSVMSDSLQPHGLQHTRLPRPSPTPEACSNSCPLSRWCHPLLSPSPPAFNLSQHQGLFQGVGSLHKVAKLLEFQYWSIVVSTLFLFYLFIFGFPGGSEGKASACNVGDWGSIPGLVRSLGEGKGNPFQYSCLEKPMDGGAW